MASESCEISDGYKMFSESQANAFIQSVSKLLPQTSNTNGTVNTDVNGTVIDMAISMDIDTCNTTTNEVCAVQADVKGAWAPRGSSAVTCVNVREKQYSSCGCLNAGVSLAGEIALRDAISSARAKFVVDANAAFENLVVAQKVATNPDVVSTIQTEYKDQVAEATAELQADTGKLEELKEQNERMMREFTELAEDAERGRQDSADEAAADILKEAFNTFKDDDMETLLPKLSFSLCTFVQTLMAPKDVQQFPEGSVAEHAQRVVRERLPDVIKQAAQYIGEVTNALDQLTGKESLHYSLLCTIQKQNFRDGYVCFPTEHAIEENNMLNNVDNPANYITQLLQAGSFEGINEASIAQSNNMDYCTMDRPAYENNGQASLGRRSRRRRKEDSSDDDE